VLSPFISQQLIQWVLSRVQLSSLPFPLAPFLVLSLLFLISLYKIVPANLDIKFQLVIRGTVCRPCLGLHLVVVNFKAVWTS